jgi:hypothetical protein
VTVVVLTVGDDDAVDGELSAVGVVVAGAAEVVGVVVGDVVGVVVGLVVGDVVGDAAVVSVGVGVADDVADELDSPAEKRGSWNSIQPSR